VRLGDYEALAGALLDDLGQPLTDWWPAAFALQRVPDERSVRALRALARTDTVYTRAFAIRGLGELGDQGAASLLLPMISDTSLSAPIIVESIRAAGRLKLSAAGQALTRLAFDGALPPMLRAEAVRALADTGAGDAQDGLLDLISDESQSVRAAVFGTLASLDPELFVIVLSGLEPDPHWRVRSALVSALATLPADQAVPRLQLMLDDEDQRVVPAVLNALTRVGAPGVEAVLLERLQDDDPVVRMAAAANLGELMPAGAERALVDAYRFGERDTTYVARAAALAALTRYGPAAATETLTAALADADWALRVRAAELLASLTGSAASAEEIRPAPSRRAAQFYDAPELTAPTVSPHAFIDTDKGTIEIEMAVLDAPLTTDNFMRLARQGFFDGLTFHRVVPNFVVQGGDPRADGEGGPGFTIRDEINQRPYLRGLVGMALDWRDTGGSQFFITQSPQPHLDGRYTVFGHVVSGIEVVDRLEVGDLIQHVRVWNGVLPLE
jgi:cyclophilin family peptidyl-prolyl cis-trans isomerase/HEAT repeat protein